MIQMLRDFGKADTNETDTGMAWMGHPTPLDSMPGMATEAQLDQLGQASGADADQLFVQLMTAHHQGGIHMADDAAQHANESQVRDLARQISRFAGRGDHRDASSSSRPAPPPAPDGEPPDT